MASIKVAVRVRPINQREIRHNSDCIIEMEDNKTKIFAKSNVYKDQCKEFTFDYSYFSYDKKAPNFASQEQVFNDLGVKVVENAYSGYNACVFAYGQTGSGKTYTMMGAPDNLGLIPRICQMLFQRMEKGKSEGISYHTEVSYMEIYNEKARDLLKPKQGHSLRIREHPKLGPYVENLSRYPVMDYSDVEELMKKGNQQRTTASTGMNDTSSRSHAIFTLNFVQAKFECDTPSETSSKVHLVDLAGSERADATGATGRRLLEGSHINKSLVTLGSVISALADQSTKSLNRSSFIPYRDSVLTWLLKDSLGGNSQTVMIATISPACINYAESLSTLRYANRAKNIINKPTINEDPNVKLIRELRDEINRLRLRVEGEHVGLESPQIQQQIRDKEVQEKLLRQEWTDKWKETASILQEQNALGLRKAPLGQGVTLDSEKPHLLGINDDLFSTGMTLYNLKEGTTTIGSGEKEDFVPDIVLNNDQILSPHCEIIMTNNEAILKPYPEAVCWVNTLKVENETVLTQGCLIVLGGTSMFRYNNPAEAQRLRKEANNKSLSRMSLLTRSITDLLKLQDSSHVPNLEIIHDQPTVNEDTAPQADSCLREVTEEVKSLLESNFCNTDEKFKNLDSKLDRFLIDKQEALKVIESAVKSPGCLEDKNTQKHYENFRSLLKQVYDEALARWQTQTETSLPKENVDQLIKEEHDLDSIVRSQEEQVKLLKCVMEKQAKLLEDRIMEQLASSDLSPENKKLCADIMGEKNYDIEDSINFLVDVEKDRILMTLDDIGDQKLNVEAELDEIKKKMGTSDLAPAELDKLTGKLECLKRKHASLEKEEIKAETMFENQMERMYQTQDLLTNCRPHLQPKIDEIGKLEESLLIQQGDMERTQGKLENIRKQLEDSRKRQTSFKDRIESNKWKVIKDLLSAPLRTQEELGIDCKGSLSEPLRKYSKELKTETQQSNECIVNGSRSDAAYVSATELPENKGACASELVSSHNGSRGTVQEEESEEFTTETPPVIPLVQITGSSSTDLSQPEDSNSDKTEIQLTVLHEIQKELDMLEALQDSDEINMCDDLNEHIMWEETEVAEDRLAMLIEQEVHRRIYEERMYREKQLKTERALERKERQRELKQLHAHYQRELENLKEQIALKESNLQIIGMLGEALNPLAGSNAPRESPNRSAPSPTREIIDNCGKYVVRIPSFIVRGSLFDSHHEFEVKIQAGKDRWSICRRFTKFRELHQALIRKYGDPIARLRFPPRKLFAWNTDRLLEERKVELEIYLNELLEECRHIKESPLYPCRDRPNKLAVFELSPFFKRGFFEATKHGTC